MIDATAGPRNRTMGSAQWWRRPAPPESPDGPTYADLAFLSDLRSAIEKQLPARPDGGRRLRVLLFGAQGMGTMALLHLLRRETQVVGVVTLPRVGRGRQAMATLAMERMIPVFRPESIDETSVAADFGALEPDLIAVAGYPRMIPDEVLSFASLGGVNLHPSLLPAYRGPCPWRWAIIRGETRTGVSVHALTQEMNGGDILTQEEVPIDPDDTEGSLYRKLCGAGGDLLARTVDSFQSNTEIRVPQDRRQASFHTRPQDEDARIRWTAGAREIRNLVRGLRPRPGAWTSIADLRFGIEEVTIENGPGRAAPGTIIGGRIGALKVATGNGVIGIREMSLQGRTRPRARATARDETARIPTFRPGVRFDDVSMPSEGLEAS